MREIKLSPHPASKLRRLTVKSAKIHLYACSPGQYAIVEAATFKTLYAFESPALTQYLKKDVEEFQSVSLHECNCRFGTTNRLTIELRLKLANGTTLAITDWDRIYKSYELKEHSNHAETLYSPLSTWDIIPDYPYVYMLLTGRLVDFIDTISVAGQKKHLLNIIWREHQLKLKQYPSETSMIVDAEFVTFVATPLNSHLVKYDLEH